MIKKMDDIYAYAKKTLHHPSFDLEYNKNCWR